MSACESWKERFDNAGILAGDVVSLEGEYGPEAIASFIELLERRCLIVPLSTDSQTHLSTFLETAQVQKRVLVTAEVPEIIETGRLADHHLYQQLLERSAPGLVLFTSGSTGENKAAVHDLSVLLDKFEPARRKLRTIAFLQLDHIGGINTLLYTMANGGAIIVSSGRSPKAVCEAIDEYGVELLPTSPTFLHLLLLSGELERRQLPSLKLVTYGTEPMPKSTLQRLHKNLPNVQLQQTYGMTEIGILRSKSRQSDSLWVRVGGEGFETKVVDGRLWVRAKSAMLGYLNAPSPFDDEGYLDTGDRVEVDGEWVRFLGRSLKSSMLVAIRCTRLRSKASC